MSEARWGGQPPAELVPENAPFDEEQRAWLNGFLAGLLGLANGDVRSTLEAARSAAGALARSAAPSPHVASAASAGFSAAAALVDPAWKNPALSLEQRLELSEGEELEARLGSAMPQLDCGQCGTSCQGYARAIASGAERDHTRCAPGGRAVARQIELLLVEPARAAASERNGSAAARRITRAPGAESPVTPAVSSGPRLVGLGREPGHAHRLRVKSQRKLTLADAGSEIREIVLELGEPPLAYRAGDCLAVFPHNDPDLVRALLRAVGARGQEIVTTPSGATEVWRCLLEDLDITHVRDETLRLFAEEAGREQDVGVLRESLSQATPSSFDLLDLLAMFPSPRPSLERIVATLGALEPRQYAIASSPTYHPGELHLAVRVVRAERGGRERKGVASQFLSDGVFRGDDVFVRVQSGERFVLPLDRPGPMIMLGSGTGVARYRAFLQELEARGRRGNTWLIMASCFEGDEALYEAELKAWSRIGVLEHLDVVKLGQRGRRLGPEDVLRKRARRVVSWLDRGAFVYACGEGKGFSALLSDTLIDVLGRQGKMSRAEAADFLHVLRRDGRYVEEVY
ncbi:MAG TPA: (Fe-S)-binding protein [Polyangiaceae bacterium]|nr:(Fe-S)-binding protein [Polyangiaceae bacterium]